jgi:hypothetical protein
VKDLICYTVILHTMCCLEYQGLVLYFAFKMLLPTTGSTYLDFRFQGTVVL